MSTDEAERLARLIAADRRHLWHPFTPMDEWESEDPPLIAERGEGAYLIDVEGKRYPRRRLFFVGEHPRT